MHDDQLRSLLRTLEDEREPDPAFADALFNRLTLVARNERSGRGPFLLLAAALLVGLLAASVAIGSGLLRLPMTVDASATPNPSASAMASPDPSSSAPDPNPTGPALPSPSSVPSLEGGIAYAAADGLRVRTEPSADAEAIATLRAGQLMGVVGAPTAADSMVWHPVRIGPGDLAGWVAAGPEGEWLRAVGNGAIAFRCETGCADDPVTVSVTPFGDDNISGLASAEIAELTWSPDGSRLVGTRQDGTVVVMDADGSNVTDLGAGFTPSWSPDGTRLAWSSGTDLVVTDAELRPTALELGLRGAGRAGWSADGSRLAFVSIDCDECPVDEPIVGDPPTAIFTVAADGTELRQLTGRQTEGFPTWAPDGSRLLFLRHDLSGVRPTQALVIAADGGEPAVLLDGGAIYASAGWSPDGTRMALGTPDGLVVLDGAGGSPQVLVAMDEERSIVELHWSPAGDYLLYGVAGGVADPGVSLWIASVDGSSAPRQISGADMHASQASWQPVLAPMP